MQADTNVRMTSLCVHCTYFVQRKQRNEKKKMVLLSWHEKSYNGVQTLKCENAYFESFAAVFLNLSASTHPPTTFLVRGPPSHNHSGTAETFPSQPYRFR
jgi:hypothetical protein